MARGSGNDPLRYAHCIVGDELRPLDVVRGRHGAHGVLDLRDCALSVTAERKQLKYWRAIPLSTIKTDRTLGLRARPGQQTDEGDDNYGINAS